MAELWDNTKWAKKCVHHTATRFDAKCKWKDKTGSNN